MTPVGTNGAGKGDVRRTAPTGGRPTVGGVAEKVAELEAYRSSARALAARILSAQERERVRISRELHDETGQALTLLLVRLQLIETMTSEDAVKNELAELRELVGAALDGVRRLAVHLGPSVLEDLGLCSALDWLADRVRAETGLRVDLHLGCGCTEVTDETAVTIFRVAQEALTNIVRHAGATRAELTITSDGDSYTLSVSDDGIGFDAAAARADPEASVGLFGMQERVALVGGTLDITSTPGRGTRVLARVPMREETPL